MRNEREKIIANYIEGYNQFDIDKMVRDLDENIKFENIENGEPNLTLTSLASFKEQAEKAASFFSSRIQTVKGYIHRDEETETVIGYHAVLALDLPNGLKKGEVLRLEGTSIFKFAGNKIVELKDIS
jgi:hypothetical protein